MSKQVYNLSIEIVILLCYTLNSKLVISIINIIRMTIKYIILFIMYISIKAIKI